MFCTAFRSCAERRVDSAHPPPPVTLSRQVASVTHGMLKMAMAADTIFDPSTQLPSRGAPRRGIFWGQELAGAGAIITRMRLPVCADEEPDL